MTYYLFYFLSFIAIFSAVLVITARSPIHSALYLVLTFFALSAHYLLMNAQFLFIVNVIVYAGAVMVLFLHVIMLVNLKEHNKKRRPMIMKFIAVISGGLLLTVLVGVVKEAEMTYPINEKITDIGLVENLGKVLFSEFLLPFEIASVLILSAVIGAVILGKKEKIIKPAENHE